MSKRSVASGASALVSAVSLATLIALQPGCGAGAEAEPKTPADETVAEPAADPAPAAERPSPASDDPAAAGADAAAGPAPQAPAKDPNAPREVKYVLTPEGLKVEVAGVRFLASAEPKQIGQGWGVKVSVKAEVLDGKSHLLLSPKAGPLAFAAAVFKKGSTEAERIPDSREGEGEQTLSSGSPALLSRDFPAKGGRVLGSGETLDLEVGLWGLGETADDRRPVKQFFHVKMKVDKGKPKAIVEPPASAAK